MGIVFDIIIKLTQAIHNIISLIIDPPFPSSKYPPCPAAIDHFQIIQRHFLIKEFSVVHCSVLNET